MIPSAARMRTAGALRSSDPSTSFRPANPAEEPSHFVDFQYGPFSTASDSGSLGAMPGNNPVPDLVPDEFYEILRAHDLISEKGIRDHIIRKAFKAMRDEQALKSCEALARLQTVYPYLQVDTIRKIIYRIGPGCNRKAMM